MIDPLEAWRALSSKQRETIEALLRKERGDGVEVFAAKREGAEVAVHAIYYSWYDIPQQVGADLTSRDRVTSARSTTASIDERDPFDSAAAIAELKRRSIEAIFGPELSAEEDAMLAAIEAAPDEDGPRLVYADWLQQRGDPRGEFIALQLAGKRTTRANLTGIPWSSNERTIFERGFIKVLAVTETYDFVTQIDCYARIRPLPDQFVGKDGSLLVASITPDRRRFVVARTLAFKPKKRRETGEWNITVGRCADRSTIFSTTLPWSWDQKALSNEINRIELVDDDTIKLWFASGERAKRIKIR